MLAINHDDGVNRSILGRISDAVSAVARAILPDESENEVIDLPERTALANRKTPADVYQSKKCRYMSLWRVINHEMVKLVWAGDRTQVPA